LYLQGAIVGDHLMLLGLNAIDPAAPEIVLKELPVHILERIAEYAVGYQRVTAYVNYGSLPSDQQVAAAKNWIENSLAVGAPERS